MLEAVLAVAHDGEGVFPCWPAGTVVSGLASCALHEGWLQGCVNGRSAYFPAAIVANGCLTAAYNPTELALPTGSCVQLLGVWRGWAWVAHDGQQGWLPLAKLQSTDMFQNKE